MPFSDFAIPGIGAVGSIVGGAIARGQAKRDFRAARKMFEQDREYNSPKNQLARIHEAGLPSAAYFTGGIGSQSDVFSGDIANTDNGIGEAAKQIGNYHSNRLERIQVEAAEENLKILTNTRKISDVETADALSEVPDWDKFKVTDGVVEVAPNIPRVIANKRQKSRQEDLREKTMKLQNELLDLQKQVSGATTQEQIATYKAKLDQIIQDTLSTSEDVKSKGIENKYLENEYQYDQDIREARRAFWSKIRVGKMPSFGEIFQMLAMAAEARL